MARLNFQDLLNVYRNTSFGNEGEEARLKVPSVDVVDLLTQIEEDDDAAAETGLTLLDDVTAVRIGAEVQIRVGPPRAGLGILAWSMPMLLNAPRAQIEEPEHYFLVDARFARGDTTPPDIIVSYRRVLKLVGLFTEAASYLDRIRSELVFVKDSKVFVPVQFDAHDLSRFPAPAAEQLLAQFGDDLHREQKLGILSEALVNLCRAQSTARRFAFLLNNLDELVDAVRQGYRLFASSFSYSKIRGDLENARIEYTTKIHKTIVDIQNQLLGIPVATVIVGSQMKATTVCGAELWMDLAVLSGAWIFVVLLLIAIVNQWLTLGVIVDDLVQQRKKLESDYAAISQQFIGMFQMLGNRVWWHRFGLAAVGFIAFLGASLATVAYHKLVSVSTVACVTNPPEVAPLRDRQPRPAPPATSPFPGVIPAAAHHPT